MKERASEIIVNHRLKRALTHRVFLLWCGMCLCFGFEANAQTRAKAAEANFRLGTRLSESAAKNLEAKLARRPNSPTIRNQLIGYYWTYQNRSIDAREALSKQLWWFIKEAPDHEVLSLPLLMLNLVLGKEEYGRAFDTMAARLKSEPENLGLLANLIRCKASERSTPLWKTEVLTLVSTAERLEPTNPKWPKERRMVFLRECFRTRWEDPEIAGQALASFEEAHRLSPSRRKRSLNHYLASCAFGAGRFDTARSFALEMIKKAPGPLNASSFEHQGHIILGRIAFQEGKINEAKEHLFSAIDLTEREFARLNISGPSMALTKDLLEAGEKAVVLEYLNECAEFWTQDRGKLRAWTTAIEAGREPDFGAAGFR